MINNSDVYYLSAANDRLTGLKAQYLELVREWNGVFQADEYTVPKVAEEAKTLENLLQVLPDGEKLESLAGGSVGETRTVTVDDTGVVLGDKQEFRFLRSVAQPHFAFLMSTDPPAAEGSGPRFQPSLFASGLIGDGPFGVKERRTDVSLPLFSLKACGLCGLGIKHSRRCREDRLRVIEDRAFAHGIRCLITNGISAGKWTGRFGGNWWNSGPEEVAFVSSTDLHLFDRYFGHDDRGRHLSNEIRVLFRHFLFP